MSDFADQTPITIVVTTTEGALAALIDHPAMLRPDEPAMFWVSAVHRGVNDLRNAKTAAVSHERFFINGHWYGPEPDDDYDEGMGTEGAGVPNWIVAAVCASAVAVVAAMLAFVFAAVIS